MHMLKSVHRSEYRNHKEKQKVKQNRVKLFSKVQDCIRAAGLRSVFALILLPLGLNLEMEVHIGLSTAALPVECWL